MSLNEKVRNIILSTVPTLAEHGTNITSKMYKIMFTEYPELKNLFNMTHIRADPVSGYSPQDKALANAIYLYAANINEIDKITKPIQTIINKHVSLNVERRHYSIVGSCLIRAMKEELNLQDGDEIINAWIDGYWYLANFLMDEEEKLKKLSDSQEGSWHEYYNMEVCDIVDESIEAKSFYFKKPDNSKVPIFLSGQYLSIRIPGEETGLDYYSVRNYSISSSVLDRDRFRITVQKIDSDPSGIVSTYLHEKVAVGSILEIGMPRGSFKVDFESPRKHCVFISGGNGITPLMSMLDDLVNNHRDKFDSVSVIQSVRNPKVHLFSDNIESFSDLLGGRLVIHVFYSRPGDDDYETWKEKTIIHFGRIEPDRLIKAFEPNKPTDADFYICGPVEFTQFLVNSLAYDFQVPMEQINYECFGPDVIDL